MAYTAADYDTAIAKATADNNPAAAAELESRKAALSAPAKEKAAAPDYDAAIARAMADNNPEAAAELRRRKSGAAPVNLDTYGDDAVADFDKKHGKPAPDEPAPPNAVSNFISELAQGKQQQVNTFYNEFSLGTFDDIKAAISAADQLGTVEDINTGRDDRSFFTGEGGFGGEGSKIRDFWDNQQDFTEEASIAREKFAQENPGEALLLSLAGGAASIVGGVSTRLGAAGVAKGTQLAAKAGLNAKTAGVVGAAGGTAAVAGAEGAIYGTATMDGRINETSDKLIHVATFAGLGLVAGGALGGGFKAVGNKLASRSALKATKKGAQFDMFLNDVAETRKGIQTPDMEPIKMVDAIMEKSGIDNGWNAKDVERAIMADLAPSSNPTPAELEIMNAYREADMAVFSSAPKAEQGKTAKVIDMLGGSINTRVRNLSPTASNYMIKSDFRKATSIQNYELDMDGFKNINKLKHQAIRPEIKAAWLANDVEGVAALIAKTGDESMIEGFAAIRKNNKEIATALRKSGVDVPEGEYLPRRVKNATKLRQRLNPAQNASAQAALSAASRKLYGKGGKPAMLTEREVAEVYSQLGHVTPPSKGGRQTESLTSSNKRTVKDDLAIENADMYYDPLDASLGYMREGVNLVENRLMMFGEGNAKHTIDRARHNSLRQEYRSKPRKKSEAEWIKDHEEVTGLAGAKITLDEGIENMVRMTRGGGVPNTIKEDELRRLLKVRYGKGEESAPKWISDLKNIGMMTVLATPKAAALQVSEIGHSFAFNGVGNTAKAIVRSMMPASPNKMRVNNIGFADTIGAEFNGDLTSTSKWLGKIMTGTGFKATDRFGKNIYLDAAQLKTQKQFKSQKGALNFDRKWSTIDPDTGLTNNNGVFTPAEIGKIQDDLENGVVAGLREGESPELALLMFHELSGIQPLTLSQLPEGMLGNPALRFAYTLKSFALKQADILRTKVVQEFSKGNAAKGSRAAYHYKEGSKNALAYTLYTGGSYTLVNEARQALFSFGADPIELDPMTITDSFIQHMLSSFAVVNKYSIATVQNEGLGKAIGGALLPPVPMIEAGISTTLKMMNGEIDEDASFADNEISRALFGGAGELLWHIYGSGQKSKEKQHKQRQRENRERMRELGL